MAHFAELDNNNIVVRVIVVADEHEADGENWCRNLLGGFWKKTSYNTRAGVHSNGGTPYRKNYAGIGYSYDPERDAFIPAKPFNSWILNEDTCLWDPPIPMPTDEGKLYKWDEDTLNWVVVASRD
jgi:hypothetical protein